MMSECSKNALVSLQTPWKIVVDLFFTRTLTVFTTRFRRSFSNLGLVPLGKKAKKKKSIYIGQRSETSGSLGWGKGGFTLSSSSLSSLRSQAKVSQKIVREKEKNKLR